MRQVNAIGVKFFFKSNTSKDAHKLHTFLCNELNGKNGCNYDKETKEMTYNSYFGEERNIYIEHARLENSIAIKDIIGELDVQVSYEGCEYYDRNICAHF